MNWWQRRGLRFKMAVGVVLILLVVLTAAMVIVVEVLRWSLRGQEERAAAQLNAMFVNNVRSQMLANNWDGIQTAAEEAGQDEEAQMEVIAIYGKKKDTEGPGLERTVMSVFATGFPEGRTIPRETMEVGEYSEPCAMCHNLTPAQRPKVQAYVLEGQAVLRTAVPLRNEVDCQGCHGTQKTNLGMSLIDFRLDRLQETTRRLTMVMGLSFTAAIVLVLAALYFLQNRMVVRPLRELVQSTQAVAQGNWSEPVPVRSGDEAGRLGSAFNDMTAQLSAAYAKLQQALSEREEKAAELQQALDQVQQGQDEQERLLRMIREMSTPVIPVQEGVLVMPLVGVIDSARARSIVEALLPAIENEGARVVILDITGVPMVDTAVAQALLLTARAAHLLGAAPVLVGITPPVAETIVALGVDLSDLVTRADLQSGLEYAQKRLRLSM